MAMKEKNPDEEQIGIKTIELYKKSRETSDIYSTLDCSRNWLYKWLKRYQSNDQSWYKEHSRTPKIIKRPIDKKTLDLYCMISNVHNVMLFILALF
jgi:transposase-like protein